MAKKTIKKPKPPEDNCKLEQNIKANQSRRSQKMGTVERLWAVNTGKGRTAKETEGRPTRAMMSTLQSLKPTRPMDRMRATNWLLLMGKTVCKFCLISVLSLHGADCSKAWKA